MISYVNFDNIDDRIISKAVNTLEQGGLVAFPNDTNWSIACSIKSKTAIQKLKRLKGAEKNYTFTIIGSSISELSEIAIISNSNFKILKRYTPGPFVFILPALKKVEKIINLKRPEVGVRIPQNPIPANIIKALGCPIFAITASRVMTDLDWWDKSFALANLFEFGWELEEIKELDMIIDTDTGEPQEKHLSTVVNLTGEEPEIIRQGEGIFE